MYDQFIAYFSAKVFEDPEDNRRSQILNTILIVSMALMLIFVPITALVEEKPGPGILIRIAIFLVLFIMHLAYKAGNLNSTSIALITILWTLIAAGSLFLGGVLGGTYVSFFIIIYTASLVLSSRATYILTALTISYGFILVFLSNFNLLPESQTIVTPLSFLTSFSTFIILLALFAGITNNYHQATLDQSKQDREILEIKNEELSELQSSLEKAIEDRTSELQRRNKILETIALIVKDAAQHLQTQTLIDHAVDLIAQEFNFYHVGIYLIERENEYAVLKAASSPGGKAMINRNHSLQVGKQGTVGFVTGIGQARLSQDVSFDRYHATTTELPETRSQLVLPLKSQSGIIGALDLHHNTDNAFFEDEIELLQTLADQVALAIDNAELYQETQKSLDEIRRAYGEYNQQAWIESQKKKAVPSYRYSASSKEATSIDTGNLPEFSVDGKREVPIIVRGQLVGTIDIVKDEDEAWTEEEIALLGTLSDQIGTALDSARLFSETQERAIMEKTIVDITSKIRESLDLQSILQNTARTIRDSFDLPKVSIHLTEQTEQVETPPVSPAISEPPVNGSANGSESDTPSNIDN